MDDVTQILERLQRGDSAAAAQLLPLVYAELRRLAAARMAAERPDHTLDATALVHEAYLRLVGSGNADGFADRRHFAAAAAEAMRRILIDAARRRRRGKRGGGWRRVDLAQAATAVADLPPEQLLDLDEALAALAQEDAAKAELVRLRLFAGLTLTEAAQCLSISRATADRHWRYARAWLLARLQASDAADDSAD